MITTTYNQKHITYHLQWMMSTKHAECRASGRTQATFAAHCANSHKGRYYGRNHVVIISLLVSLFGLVVIGAVFQNCLFWTATSARIGIPTRDISILPFSRSDEPQLLSSIPYYLLHLLLFFSVQLDKCKSYC